MKIMLIFIMLVLAVIASANVTFASSVIVAHIVYAGTYGNGDVYVDFDVTIDEPNCPSKRLDLSVDHPNAKNILATAYTAMALGKTVQLVTNGCYQSMPTLDNSRATYLLMYN